MWNYLKKLLVAPVLILSFLLNPFQVFAVSVSFGNTTNGGGSTGITVDRITVSPATPTSSGIITAGHARVWVSGGSSNSRLVVYSDLAGEPNNLLAVSDVLVITGTSETQENYTFSGVNQIGITAGTSYWIGVHFEDPGAFNFTYSRSSTASQQKTSTDTYSDGSEAVFTVATTTTGPIDVFIDYIEQNGGNQTLVNSTLNNSGLSLDHDGVDESSKSINDPSFSSNTAGTISCWVNPDTVLGANGLRVIFGAGGEDTDEATNFGAFFIGLRYLTTGSHFNRIE